MNRDRFSVWPYLKDGEVIVRAGSRGIDMQQLSTLTEVHELNMEAWQEWCEWRRLEKKIKIGPIAAKKQRQMLAQYPPAVQQAIIDRSIANSYQGLFPPRQKPITTRQTALIDDLTDTSWAN